MKNIVYFFLIICFSSCNPLKNFQEFPACPEDYVCAAEIIKDSSLKIKEDTIGKTYINIYDDKNYDVVKYNYGYKGRPEISDDGYSEEIYFQIPKDDDEMELKNKELSKIKLIVAKNCFCKEAGFEIINEGTFELKKVNDQYYIDLQFSSKRDLKVKSLQTKISL